MIDEPLYTRKIVETTPMADIVKTNDMVIQSGYNIASWLAQVAADELENQIASGYLLSISRSVRCYRGTLVASVTIA